jgi:hypothetical protein
MNNEGTNVNEYGRIVYDGHIIDPTIEGPKLYKRNNYYYIFAPAGGVGTGWQTILRSKNVVSVTPEIVDAEFIQIQLSNPFSSCMQSLQQYTYKVKGIFAFFIEIRKFLQKERYP